MSATFTRVPDVDGLVHILCEHGCRGDFFIQLNGGARSVKRIRYDHWRETFHVTNEIDGSKQVLTDEQLTDPQFTDIGPAICAGAFYYRAP
jgi:hypothetical protein